MKVKFKWYGFKRMPLFWCSPVVRDCECYKHAMSKERYGPGMCEGESFGCRIGPVGVMISMKCSHPMFEI